MLGGSSKMEAGGSLWCGWVCSTLGMLIQRGAAVTGADMRGKLGRFLIMWDGGEAVEVVGAGRRREGYCGVGWGEAHSTAFAVRCVSKREQTGVAHEDGGKLAFCCPASSRLVPSALYPTTPRGLLATKLKSACKAGSARSRYNRPAPRFAPDRRWHVDQMLAVMQQVGQS